ncbi:MAG: histidine kinase [Gemmatimonadaceae bacterium]|nr:histidine kinase [Gemmatimonadaceae bacterium]
MTSPPAPFSAASAALVVDPPTPANETPTDWRRFWRMSAVLHVVLFLLRFVYLWLDDLVRDDAGTALTRGIEEFTGSLGSFMLSGLLFAAWSRWPLREAPTGVRLPGYLLLWLITSVLNTTFMWTTRTLLFSFLGRGPYDYGRMPLRYLMELPGALIGVAILVLVLWFTDSLADRRQQTIRQANLERALAESRLRTLQLQLQPHFLFNALNTIASRIHDDPMLADHLIGRLADLLRVSYRRNDAALVPFRDELALLDAYAALMRARFGESLVLEVHRGNVRDETLVPPLLLQPLVENAVRHGRLERDGCAHIRVEAHTLDARLTVRVFDDGMGVTAGSPTFGTGLTTTAQRLALLFGREGTLVARNASGGGFEVLVQLPTQVS